MDANVLENFSLAETATICRMPEVVIRLAIRRGLLHSYRVDATSEVRVTWMAIWEFALTMGFVVHQPFQVSQ